MIGAIKAQRHSNCKPPLPKWSLFDSAQIKLVLSCYSGWTPGQPVAYYHHTTAAQESPRCHIQSVDSLER